MSGDQLSSADEIFGILAFVEGGFDFVACEYRSTTDPSKPTLVLVSETLGIVELQGLAEFIAIEKADFTQICRLHELIYTTLVEAQEYIFKDANIPHQLCITWRRMVEMAKDFRNDPLIIADQKAYLADDLKSIKILGYGQMQAAFDALELEELVHLRAMQMRRAADARDLFIEGLGSHPMGKIDAFLGYP